MSSLQSGKNDATKLVEIKGSMHLGKDLTLLDEGLIQADYMGD